MLTDVTLHRFRGFDDHVVPLREFTIVVGRNNAGKTTFVEALRLLALVFRRAKSGSYSQVRPSWLQDTEAGQPGILPGRTSYQIETYGLVHSYGEPPVSIVASMETGAEATIWISEHGDLYATLYHGKQIRTAAHAQAAGIPNVACLPQVGPLSSDEQLLKEDYVLAHLSSRLSSRHFRNQLHFLPEHFDKFRDLCETTWRKLEIKNLEMPPLVKRRSEPLRLMVRDGQFTGEIGMMGHGLQMWLQTMWFLARVPEDAILVLDEPDVYLHADLQRKLIRMVRELPNQVIVTTHSTEILSEVEAEQVLSLDREQGASRFVATISEHQRILDDIGGVSNLHLLRLWSSRRFLVHEGQDIGILKIFHDKLFPESQHPFDAIPRRAIGRGDIGHVIRWPEIVTTAVGPEVCVYCIVDSDYVCPEELSQWETRAEDVGLNLHQWSRKEIENYLIVPGAIRRLIAEEAVCGSEPLDEGMLENELDRIADELKQETLEKMVSSCQKYYGRGLEAGTVLARVMPRLAQAWETQLTRWGIVSGKDMISRLSHWTQSNYGVSLSSRRLARSMSAAEIPDEVVAVLDAIEHGRSFPSANRHGPASPQ